jgi:hypothetical protein
MIANKLSSMVHPDRRKTVLLLGAIKGTFAPELPDSRVRQHLTLSSVGGMTQELAVERGIADGRL